MFDAEAQRVAGIVDHRWPDPKIEDLVQPMVTFRTTCHCRCGKAGFGCCPFRNQQQSQGYARSPEGVWTLPPSLALGDTDREKYLAIGESDRMTLKFIKPE
jgi:hypothetical protein